MNRQAYLECSTGSGAAPKRFDLTEFPARIGRQPDCTVQLNVARISRVHAEIRRDGNGGLQITDLGSTNGTFVNGRRIETFTPIASGDVIHVGDQEMRLVEEQMDETPTSDELTQLVGCRRLVHLLLDQPHFLVADMDDIAAGNWGKGFDAPAVDEGAVGAAQIGDLQSAIAVATNLGMDTGDSGNVELHGADGLAPDSGREFRQVEAFRGGAGTRGTLQVRLPVHCLFFLWAAVDG